MKSITKHTAYRRILNILLVLILLYSLSHTQSTKHHKSQFTSQNQYNAFIESLKNALITKNTADDRHFRLRNGEYHEHTSSPLGFELRLLTPILSAHLGSHNAEYAIAPMLLSAGGSGVFYSINIFRNRHGNAEHVAFADLGDRIGIDSIYVAHDTIFVDLMTHGPNEGMMRPTKPRTYRFLFRNNSLIQVNNN